MQHAFLCATCGIQFPPSAQPPEHCPICEDERQYVHADGQQWTTPEQLVRDHANDVREEDPHVWSIHTRPSFAIDQRAFFIETGAGNILWDCVALLDEAAIEHVRARGGIQAIAVSHPHYYTSMVDWSAAFGNAPIYIHERDRQWVMRPGSCVQFWTGDSHPLFGGATLVHTPGHFDGFQVLHWAAGAEGRGALFAGDQPQVCMDRRWVSFLYSYPNYIPLGPAAVEDIVRRLEPWRFDRIYGAFGRHVRSDAKETIRRSAARYIDQISKRRNIE